MAKRNKKVSLETEVEVIKQDLRSEQEMDDDRKRELSTREQYDIHGFPSLSRAPIGNVDDT